MRFPGFLAASLAAVLSVGLALGQSASTNAEGNWSLAYSGQPLGSSTITFHQQGDSITGAWGEVGTITGKRDATNSYKFNVKWTNGIANGWAKLVFAHDWNSFSGDWGRAQKAYGSFTGERITHVHLNTAGVWDTTLTGIKDVSARITLKQSGTSVTGTWPAGGHMTGTLAPGSVEVRGTWVAGNGHGPFDLTFSPSGVIFEGSWSSAGLGPSGRIVGHRIPKF
ncbi:MAG: hypothetical protein WA814_06475 [Candidatus Baltobacteraceae bacterium]